MDLKQRLDKLEQLVFRQRTETRWIKSIPTLQARVLDLTNTRQHRDIPQTPPIHIDVLKVQQDMMEKVIKTIKEPLEKRIQFLEDQMMELTCCLCFTRKRNACAVPCRHASFCTTCMEELMSSARPQCPICRGRLSKFVQLR